MIRVSPQLYRLAQDYLDLVARGDLTAERADAHDRMMARMRAEGIPYRNREEARNKAYGFTDQAFIVLAYWQLLTDFLGEVLDEIRIQASRQNLRFPC